MQLTPAQPFSFTALPRLAFVHDNFLQQGGAERVAEVIANSLPTADLFTTALLADKIPLSLAQRRIRHSFMSRMPGLRKYYRHYFLLYTLAAASLPLSKYDVIVSSCCGFAKMIRPRRDSVHICYCHTPTRWIWRFEDYAAREHFSTATRSILKLITSLLRSADLYAAKKTDFFLANSRNVAERIHEFYGRDAVVLHPPVECRRFQVSYSCDDSYLIVSRLISYKRIDLAIEACEKLGRKLIIVGDGPDRKRLESLAGPNTVLTGRLSDEEVSRAFQNCRALLFPGEEDFGMTPLEANASGKPCIAFGRGGALESVIEGSTGILFSEPTADSMADAILRCESHTWNPDQLRAHAELFDTSVFTDSFLQIISVMTAEKMRSVMPVSRVVASGQSVPNV
jgi:glycosyltransferase involved in cell wall biosynthesis